MLDSWDPRQERLVFYIRPSAVLFSGPASHWPPAAPLASDTTRRRKTCNTFWRHHEKTRRILLQQFGDVAGHDVQHAGGIVFIALMVALVAQDSPPPPPAYYQAQAAQLSNDLAAITVFQFDGRGGTAKNLLRLQDPHLHPATNLMRLPNISDTSKRRGR
jgi:hypothetical protein